MFLDLCPNCELPVIHENKQCTNHCTAQSLLPLVNHAPICTALPCKAKLVDLCAVVVEVTGVRLQELCKSRIDSHYITEARHLLMYVAFLKLHYKHREIEKYLNQSKPYVIISIARVRDQLLWDKRMQKTLKEIERRLSLLDL